MAQSLNTIDEDYVKTMEWLREVLGDFFAEKLYGDKDWACHRAAKLNVIIAT